MRHHLAAGMTLVMYQAGPNLEDMVVDILADPEVMVDMEELENMLEDLEGMVDILEMGATVVTTVDIGSMVVDLATLVSQGTMEVDLHSMDSMDSMDSVLCYKSRRVLPSRTCKGESEDIKEVRCHCHCDVKAS